MEPAEGAEDSSFPGEFLSDAIALKEHNTKNKTTRIVFYTIERHEELCFKKQESFPRITDLLSGITAHRETQASTPVAGKKMQSHCLGGFLGFCGAGIK